MLTIIIIKYDLCEVVKINQYFLEKNKTKMKETVSKIKKSKTIFNKNKTKTKQIKYVHFLVGFFIILSLNIKYQNTIIRHDHT